MNDVIMDSHRDELANQGHAVYALFGLLEESGLDMETGAVVANEVAQLADHVGFLEISLRADLLRSQAQKLLDLGPAVAPQAFRAWRRTIAGVAQSRRATRELAHTFGDLLCELKTPALGACLDLLPPIAPRLAEIGHNDLIEILRVVNTADSSEDREAIVEVLTACAETTGAILMGCLQLAWGAAQRQRLTELRGLIASVPVSAMEESADSERLIPAIAALCETCAVIDDKAWTTAFDLAVILTAENHSTAYSASVKLTRRIPGLGSDTAGVYLGHFAALAGSVGTRVSGFCLRQLPKHYARHGIDATSRLVETCVNIARTTGQTSAQWFLEGKTRSAREFMG